MIQIVLFIILALIALKVYVNRKYSYWQDTGAPNIKARFPLGNAQGIGKKDHFAVRMANIYKEFRATGPFCGIHVVLSPVAVATDLDFVKNVLVKDFHNFPDRGAYYNSRDDPLSAHLFSLDHEPWKKLRNKLTPTFTSGKMKFMFPTIVEVAERMNKLISHLVTSEDSDTSVEIRDLLSKYTTDVIGSCAFGIECNSLFGKDAVFQNMGRRAFEEPRYPHFVRLFFNTFKKLGLFFRMGFTPKDVSQFFLNVVHDTIEERRIHKTERSDFMQILIKLMGDDSEALSLNEVAAQSFVFFLAGFETSSTTLTYCLYELSKNPQLQQKVRQHVLDAITKTNGELTYESIKDMKYLDQTIKETLRRYPPLAHLSRSIKDDYRVPGTKLMLPKKGMVIIPVLGIHNDPNIYPNPEVFDPDRFSEKEIHKRHSCAFLAFGEGPRNCIGLRFGMMQAQVGLATILLNYELSLNSKTPPIEVVPRNFLLTPKNGIWIDFKKIYN